MVPNRVSNLVELAIGRTLDDMRRDAPYLAQQADSWFRQLARGARAADYFVHPLAFPMLLLPWWMEQSIENTPDEEFQADLIYSSINGYYFIRMIDNVMDGHSNGEQHILPMLGFFHGRFQSVYQRYFPWNHPFWTYFHKIGDQSAESAVHDAALTDIDRHAFETIAGRKVIGGKIPLAAVALRYEQPDILAAWQPFYDKLGCWHQMYNDLLGWLKDLHNETPSYFLCEGMRRKRPDQSIGAWVVTTGFNWGLAYLENEWQLLLDLASALDSSALIDYLHARRELLHQQAAQITKAFHSLDPLLEPEP